MSDLINIDALADAISQRILGKLQPPVEPLAYTVAETAKKLGLSVSTVNRMVRDRDIAVVRRGTRVLIPRQSIIEWLERNSA